MKVGIYTELQEAGSGSSGSPRQGLLGSSFQSGWGAGAAPTLLLWEEEHSRAGRQGRVFPAAEGGGIVTAWWEVL